MSEESFDWRGFSEEMGLDASTVKSLYRVFGDELEEDLAALRLAAAQADGEACVRLIHKIKGTSASYRATRLHELASEADGLFKQRQTSSAARLLPEVLAAGGTVCQHIDRWQE
jgi:HPt (histidine-containing phosphotransfer) domain-containing protein